MDGFEFDAVAILQGFYMLWFIILLDVSQVCLTVIKKPTKRPQNKALLKVNHYVRD